MIECKFNNKFYFLFIPFSSRVLLNLFDLLILVLEKTVDPEKFTIQLLDVLITNFDILKRNIEELHYITKDNLSKSMNDKHENLLDTLKKSFFTDNWTKSNKHFEFFLKVSNNSTVTYIKMSYPSTDRIFW